MGWVLQTKAMVLGGMSRQNATALMGLMTDEEVAEVLISMSEQTRKMYILALSTEEPTLLNSALEKIR